jgi:hypothetical protein
MSDDRTANEYLRDLDREQTLAGIALRLREDGADPATVFAAVDAENSLRCDPPLDIDALVRIAEDPWRYSPAPRRRILTASEALKQMNGRYAVVREAGKTAVISEERDPMLGRNVIIRSSLKDIRDFHMNALVPVLLPSGHLKYLRLGQFWLEHPNRRQYKGVVFSPGHTPDGYYNLWTGFSVKPHAGDWGLMQDHIFDNICSGNSQYIDYVLAWMAAGVQRPDQQAEVALVLKGSRGVGKGVFAAGYGSLFGRHYLHIAQNRHLVGNFNAHLQDAVVVFADEAFGADDKQAEGVLKMLITETSIPIERKFRDVTIAKNVIHLLIASNNDWVIPAGMDERRFFVLQVGDTHRQDHKYFAAIQHQLAHGGREAMLYDLLEYDISAVNLRSVPDTEALFEQKVRSMSPLEHWWFQKLTDGRLLPAHSRWQAEVRKTLLYDNYTEVMQKAGVARRSVETEVGMFLKKVCPPEYPRHVRHGTVREWAFPPLDDCRAAFERYLKQPVTWS